MFDHFIQQHQSCTDIIAVVLQWIFDGFPNQAIGRKMEDRVDAVRCEDAVQNRPVAQIPFNKSCPLINQMLKTRGQIIEYHHLICIY